MKYIKFCIIIVSIFLIGINSIVLADSLTLEVDSHTISLDDTLKVIISYDNEGNFTQLDGTQNFTITSQSHQTSFQSINGVSKTVSKIHLTLKPFTTGNFTLGPAIFQTPGGPVSSNTLSITVYDDLSNEIRPTPQENTGEAKPLPISIFILALIVVLGAATARYYHNKALFGKDTPPTPLSYEFPLIGDVDFDEKITKIFLSYLEYSLYGEDLYYKTPQEILGEYDEKLSTHEKEILQLLENIKYSPDKSQKQELLEKIQTLIDNQNNHE